MRICQLFSDEKTLILDERNRHHVANVMRSRAGDICYVFDGRGNEVKAKISQLSKKEVVLDVLEKTENTTESHLKIHLFQAMCKGEKMDWIMQKSIELGVTEITPILTERCDVKLSEDRLEKKMTHWRNIIIHATEQSGRAVLAKLNEPVSLQEAIERSTQSLRLLFTPHAEKKLSDVGAGLVPTQQQIALFIGPEGGFSESETTLAMNYGIEVVLLGRRILRTETAPLTALSVLQTLYGDFS